LGSVAFAVAVFLFRWFFYPGMAGFQEQNQLFLFTWDFLVERMSVSGGLADYIAEFITQFSYIPYVGEALLAVLLVIFQRSIALTLEKDEWYALSFVAPVMLLVYMSDFYVMLSYLVALIAAVLLCALYRRHPGTIWAAIATVLGYWLIGPAIFIFTIYVSVREKNLKSIMLIALAILTVVASRLTYLQQYPWKTVFFGINYYRIPLTVPAFQLIIVIITAFLPALTGILPSPKNSAGILVGLFIGAVSGCYFSYQRDTVELVAYDQMVRNEDWEGILKRAEKY